MNKKTMRNMVRLSASHHNLIKINENCHGTSISGLFVISSPRQLDFRGSFTEVYRLIEIEKLIGMKFVARQTNLSVSQTNVMRGFHAENWNKIITVLTGQAMCAMLDTRKDSPSFGQVFTIQLSVNDVSPRLNSIYVPRGVANSVCVIGGPVHYLYTVDAFYQNRDQRFDLAINMFDPQLKINWPITRQQAIISDRDKQALSFAQWLQTVNNQSD